MREAVPLEFTEQGSGPAIVLLPGGLTGFQGWEPLLPALTASYRVINVQPLANAEGQRGNLAIAGYGAQLERECLALTLDQIDVSGAVHFVGWSNGGRIALDFAVAYPERVASLTLVEPAAMWLLGEQREDVSEFLDFMVRVAGTDLSEDDVLHFLDAVGVGPAGTDYKALPQWPVWWARRNALSWHAADVQGLRSGTEHLSSLQIPTLVIKGSHSARMMRDTTDEVSRRVTGSSVVELPGTHACLLQSADVFAEVLAQHVETASGTETDSA